MALVPCLGTALVLATQTPSNSFNKVESAKPVTWIGDHSYSIYLWHWPVLIFLNLKVFNLSNEALIASIAIVSSLVLASVTKRHIEDRFRFGRAMSTDRKTYFVAAVLMVSSLTVSISPMAVLANIKNTHDATSHSNGSAAPTTLPSVTPSASPDDTEHNKPSSSGEPKPTGSKTPDPTTDPESTSDPLCKGADEARSKFPEECPTFTLESIKPNILAVADDLPAVYKDGCWNWPPFVSRITCSYGTGKLRVALVGNSHAGQWLSPILKASQRLDFSITTYLSSSCNTTDALLDIASARQAANCLKFGKWVKQQLLSGGYDLIITSQRQVYGIDGKGRIGSHDLAVKNYQSYFQEITETSKLLVIRDIIAPPSALGAVPDCLAANSQDFSKCDWPRQSEEYTDPLWDALTSSQIPNVAKTDLNSFFCSSSSCKAVIGGLVTFRDSHHITDTYALELEAELGRAILEALSE
jgi:hypothetical protein